ncbi:MAG: tetratricopeptide repeat protein [Marinilabiliaceae bacterium]|nr:tetratricopeptide repeat protein [Marinilabiliaceae bacterium]
MVRGLLGIIVTVLVAWNLSAQNHVDSLRQVLTTIDDRQQVEILQKLSDQYFYQDIDSAFYYAHMSLAKAEVYRMSENILLAHLRLALIYQFLNKHPESNRSIVTADSLYIRKLFSREVSIQYNYYNGVIRLNCLQDLDTALIYFRKAVDTAKKIKEKEYRLRSLANIGNIYFQKGQMPLALKSYQQCNQLADSLDQARDKMYATYYIGNIYWSEGNTQVGKEYLYKAMKMASGMNDQYLLGSIANNLSLIYIESGQTDSAMVLVRKSIRCNEKANNSGSSGHVYVNYGHMLLKNEQVDSARYYADKAKTLIDPHKDIQKQINLNSLYSDLFHKQGNRKEALKYHEMSYDLARKNKLPDLEIECLDGLADYEAKMGNYKLANFYNKEANLLRDSVYNHERAGQIAFLQKTFELDQKDKQNELLKAQNAISEAELKHEKQRIHLLWVIVIGCFIIIGTTTVFIFISQRKRRETQHLNVQLEKLNSELEETNDMKNVLFSIMGHDLKSPVTSIISLSDLMIEQESTYFADKEKRLRFNNIINDSASMLLSFIDSMVYWFRNVSGELAVRPMKIVCHDFMMEMVSWYRSSARIKEIELKLQGPTECTMLGDMHMLQTVVRNLVGNAIKFSPKESVVELNWRKASEYMVISIRDYGVGLSEDQLLTFSSEKYMASTQGTDGEQGTGVGLYLCRELVKKMGGDLLVESSPGAGTEFTIHLPQ